MGQTPLHAKGSSTPGSADHVCDMFVADCSKRHGTIPALKGLSEAELKYWIRNTILVDRVSICVSLTRNHRFNLAAKLEVTNMRSFLMKTTFGNVLSGFAVAAMFVAVPAFADLLNFTAALTPPDTEPLVIQKLQSGAKSADRGSIHPGTATALRTSANDKKPLVDDLIW